MKSHGFHVSNRRGRTWIVVAAVLLSIWGKTALGADEPVFKVGFLAGGDKENNFWVKMGEFAEAVAEDLNIELNITYPPPATYPIKRAGQTLLDTLSGEDYFITVYFDAVTYDLLQTAETHKIGAFIINTEILEKDREKVGRPRGKFSQWLGHMRPNDEQAGYLLADEILSHFEDSETVNIIAINGNKTVQVAVDRGAGLEKRLSESPRAKLLDTGMGNWELEPSRVTVKKLLEQYPDTDAIWAASDPMALGALEGIKLSGKQPGKDVVVAGIDWTNEGLAAVEAGEMLATVGGHFMEAGIALLLLYDYHHEHDFTGELGASFKTPMYSVNQDNIDAYLEKVGHDPDWRRIDFKQMTKTHNPDLTSYDFSWSAISQQLQ